MRLKKIAVFDFNVTAAKSCNKIVADYQSQYKAISLILDANPAVLDSVHKDLQKLSQGHSSAGRQADFTSENIFRAILVMQKEGSDYRETSIRICESNTLQTFCRLNKKTTIDYTLLSKAFKVIQPETWEFVNLTLAHQATAEKNITINDLRTDTTVTESNIHWPTDSSLLFDVYRVIARELQRARAIQPASCPFRFHEQKIKKLYLHVTRYSNSRNKKRKREVKQTMKTLIQRVAEALPKVTFFIEETAEVSNKKLVKIRCQLANMLPAMEQVVNVAYRREVKGEKVPNEDKVFSIFEDHTELIKRGRRGKPIEFGHKFLLTQTKEKFITDYVVLEKNCSDSQLLQVVLDRHEQNFQKRPESIAADKGFCPDQETFEDLQEQVEYLGVPQKTQDFGDSRMGVWQQWRAGIEGTISCLKRAFRLSRCCFRGFKNFTSAIGSAIFCHNLVVLAKQQLE